MKQVLVVDDVAEVRVVLRTVIEEPGVEVIEAEDGEEALRQLSLQNIDLVVTDCKMPKMSGLELMQAARQADPDLRFIVVSSTASKEDFEHLAPHAIMSKPFRLTELRDAVNSALDQ
jgi:CheY-like chemotaxis protein